MSQTTYYRNPETISGALHDQLVMMDIKQGKYFALNPAATRIWELLENPLSLDALCKALLEEFDVSPDQCQQDVKEHLAEMQRLGLIREVSDEREKV
ncbi:MAG: HPr-rel-A system PqqD family peptide chaperone [Bacteroides sp.]|jgi:PqqD family protein of HPr-rel-A system|nr:HPr-rel-A system PqqD family peptide chaperone [Bacteroides sp.]